MRLAKRAVAVLVACGTLLLGGAGLASADSSGNSVVITVDVKVNACGNTIGGVGSPSSGNTCTNH